MNEWFPGTARGLKVVEDCAADPLPFMERSAYGPLQEEGSSQTQDMNSTSEFQAPGARFLWQKRGGGCEAPAAESSQSVYVRAVYNLKKGQDTFILCSSIAQAFRQEGP